VAERGDISLGVMPSSRACGARPPEGGQPASGLPIGEGPEITQSATFSQGRGLRARIVGPY